MLAELHDACRGLRASGITIQVRHPETKPLAGGRAVLRALISQAGEVQHIDLIDLGDAPRFWKIGDNQKGFPLLTLGPRDDGRPGKKDPPIPLRAGGDPALRAELRAGDTSVERRIELVRELFRRSERNTEALQPWPKQQEWLRDLAERLRPLEDGPAAAVLILLRSLLACDTKRLLASLDAAIGEALRGSVDEYMVAHLTRLVFIGGGEVLLDLEGKRNACDPRNLTEVSSALGMSEGEDNERVGECSLTGRVGRVVTRKFPEAVWPLGKTPVFTKNADIPCAARYGRSDADSCLVSRTLASELAATAEALTTDDRKGATWAWISQDRGDEYDMLLSYVAAQHDLRLAEALTTSPGVFEELARDVQSLARGRQAALNDSVSVFIVRKLNQANIKVICRTTTTLEDLRRAAELWTAGCKNIPDAIGLYVPQGKGKAADLLRPPLIVPAAIVALGRQVFIRGRTKPQDAPGPTFADAMRLFLGQGDRRRSVARSLLSVFLPRRRPLLAGIAQAALRGDTKGFDAGGALDSVTVLGLLLSALDRPKEKYMNDAAFKLGQLLAAADVLHLGYCHDVRGSGSIPSSLLGNQLLVTARGTPRKALEQMNSRWKVYQAWATKKRQGADIKPEMGATGSAWAVWRAVWVPLNVQGLATELSADLPQRFQSDMDRSELLLGYMAGPPRKPSTKTPSDVENGTNQ